VYFYNIIATTFIKFSWLGKSSLAPAAGVTGVVLVAVVLAVLGAGDTGAKVSRNKINPLLAIASDHPRPDLLVLLPATAKVVASRLVAVVPDVAARATWLGCLPSRLGAAVPGVAGRGARHGSFCPSRVFADEDCLFGVDFGRFAYQHERNSGWFSDPTSLGGSIPFRGSSSSGNLGFVVLAVTESLMSGDVLA